MGADDIADDSTVE